MPNLRKKITSSLFIASTKQHIGKTTLSLGLFAALQKHLNNPTYMKPVGQKHVLLGGMAVDKDVLLFKEHFHLNTASSAMSPILIPDGFTRKFLDHPEQKKALLEKLKKAHTTLSQKHDFILMEGTGHCGVGSIIALNNAQVAARFKAPMLLLASGGLGASFDELALNKALCDLYKVPIVGVILNKVRPDKLEMITHYITKALKRWKIPLLGCIPEDPLLSQPSMQDLEVLFKTPLLAGKEHLMRHVTALRLISSEEDTCISCQKGQLLVIPTHQEELCLSFLEKICQECGIILCGNHSPSPLLIERLRKANVPTLYTPLHSEHIMQVIHTSTVKIQVGDTEKVHEAIALIEKHIGLETILERLKKVHR